MFAVIGDLELVLLGVAWASAAGCEY